MHGQPRAKGLAEKLLTHSVDVLRTREIGGARVRRPCGDTDPQ
jgi:hypothetical protein